MRNMLKTMARHLAEGEALWLISNVGKGGALSLYSKKNGIFGQTVPQ